MDTNEVVTFVDGYHGPGDLGVKALLNNAGNDISICNTLIGAGVAGDDTVSPAIPDTRPDFTVEGTSGTCYICATMSNHRLLTFTSVTTVEASTLNAQEITQGGAEIKTSTIQTNSLSGVACIDDATFGTTSGIHDSTFTQSGTGHAIEITAPGTYNFTNITFSGYGGTAGSNLTPNSGANDAAIYNNSGGAVTINVTGGNSPSVRNGATGSPGSTTTVVSSSDFFVTNVLPGSEVRIIDNLSPENERGGVENAGESPEGLNNVTVDDDPDNSGRKRIKLTFDQADAPLNIRVVVQKLDYIYISQDIIVPASGGSLLVSQVFDRNYSNPP
jgi:hypothetical protein